MPRFECAACKALLYSSATPVALIANECPECGFLFDPAAQDPEIVVVRSDPLADRIGHLIARREISRAQARVDAERWADDGGHVVAAL